MSVEKRDYYEVLGLQRGCEVAEIKKSYRRLAMEYHPDRNPGDKAAEERFKELAEAYQVLSDSEPASRASRGSRTSSPSSRTSSAAASASAAVVAGEEANGWKRATTFSRR